MSDLQALLLGLIQGLTEYLPVSSSGHLEIGKMLLGIDPEAGGLQFDIIVHIATVMATIVILMKEIKWILKGMFKFEWNSETKYALNIIISMIPVGIVGLCFKDNIEAPCDWPPVEQGESRCPHGHTSCHLCDMWF